MHTGTRGGGEIAIDLSGGQWRVPIAFISPGSSGPPRWIPASIRPCLVYIDLNMVRAGVVKHPAQPWSLRYLSVR